MDTINKLLKKQAPKRRGKISAVEVVGDTTPQAQEAELEKANPVFVRWISNTDGSRIGVPGEWLDAPAGKLFSGPIPRSKGSGMRKMVEEVEG